ncbi:MAG: hypothetical protein RL093_975, partial [Pseudomonadota bacterium]
MGTWEGKRWVIGALSALMLVVAGSPAAVVADDDEVPVARVYVAAPAAPLNQTPEQAAAKSTGCVSCHSPVDAASMHASPAVVLGCVDCHGGDASAMVPAGAA